jgi:hypothetical protein
VLRDVVVPEQAATGAGVAHRHLSGVSIIHMAASHDTHAMACGDRQAGCAEGEAESDSSVRCLEEPSTSCPTPHVLLALMRRAHLRQVDCCTVSSALCPKAGQRTCIQPPKTESFHAAIPAC